MSVWTALQVYVNKHHTTGLVWNARGKPAVASKLSKSSPTREVNSNCSAQSPPVLTASHLAAMSLVCVCIYDDLFVPWKCVHYKLV